MVVRRHQGVVVKREMTGDEIGWCHNCGTLQVFGQAPWLELPWYPEVGLQPCCSVCRESEPWELGVLALDDDALRGCAEAGHVTFDPPRCETCRVTVGAL